MPIPNRIFDDVLSGLHLSETPSSDVVDAVRIPGPTLTRDGDSASFAKDYFLCFNKDIKPGLPQLIQRLNLELGSAGHASNEEICAIVLALYVAGNCPRNTSGLNALLENIVDAELAQYHLFPFSLPEESFSLVLSNFTVGLLSRKELKKRCSRAGTDFFRRYSKELINRFFIGRVIETRLLSLQDSLLNFGAATDEFTWRYYEAVSASQWPDFWDCLDRAQDIHVALGTPTFDTDQIRTALFTTQLNLFTFEDIQGRPGGFMSPMGRSGHQWNLLNVDRTLKASQTNLALNYDFVDWNSSELHQSLRTFCRFVSVATRHCLNERLNEGFLHFIIALDLLLGDKDESTKSVSSRVSVLSYRELEIGFEECERKVRSLYNARSKYVHEGRSVNLDQKDLAERICRIVTLSLLRLNRNLSLSRTEMFVETWKRNLDLLISTERAGKEPSPEGLQECGIIDIVGLS